MQPVLPSFYLRLLSVSFSTVKNVVGTKGSSMTPTLLSPAAWISPTSSSNLVAEPLRSIGEQRGEPTGSSRERADHKQAVGRGETGSGCGHPGLARPEGRTGLAVAALPWARPEGPRQRFPMPAEYSCGITAKVAAGRRAVAPAGGGVCARPAAAAVGSRAAEGRSEGPRSALDADGERRGIRRLAATTAGPRTGAGSRPRRRRRGRSPACELSRRSRTAYRVCRTGLRSCLGCCCLVVSVVLVCWFAARFFLACWRCCWFLFVLAAGAAGGSGLSASR